MRALRSLGPADPPWMRCKGSPQPPALPPQMAGLEAVRPPLEQD